mmetsp:Transcript_62415/g.182410  ORF Transcript_62415/g.182410 Transcript_62415/m.182410 type:complete len:296 (-) Transcript_62415:506-1393(-)
MEIVNQPRPRPLPLAFAFALAFGPALAPSTAAMTSTPRSFSTSAAAAQQPSTGPVSTTSSSGRSSPSMKPAPAPPPPKRPMPPSHLTSTQCLTTVTSVSSSMNLMEFLPSSCFASFRTSTLPLPPASRMAALPSAAGLPKMCFSFTHPWLIFSLGHLHSIHWSLIVTSCPLGRRPAIFFAFMSLLGTFLTITCMAPEALFNEIFALGSGSLSFTSPLNMALAFSASLGRSFRGTESFMRTWPCASGSRATSLRSTGISTPRSLASGAARSATFFRSASGTFAKYWHNNLPFRLFW